MLRRHTPVIGRRVRELRAAAGLTRQELADRTGLSSSNLSQLEHGRIGDPRMSTVVALAQALGVSTDVLVGPTGPTERRYCAGSRPLKTSDVARSNFEAGPCSRRLMPVKAKPCPEPGSIAQLTV